MHYNGKYKNAQYETWSRNPIYRHPFFSQAMGRNRFELILRNLCFYDHNDDTTDRLHKINQVLQHLLQNIQKVYYPDRNLSLDEALLLWRGRLYFRQYIPNKAAKYGIKLYELCTPDGFILSILIYSGKGTIQDEKLGHSYGVIEKLMEPYLNKGHAIFIDNFYSSVPLAQSMLEKNTHIVGS